MSTGNPKDGAGSARTRKDRLGEKLRENLRRRKAQLRLRAQEKPAGPDDEKNTPQTGERE